MLTGGGVVVVVTHSVVVVVVQAVVVVVVVVVGWPQPAPLSRVWLRLILYKVTQTWMRL